MLAGLVVVRCHLLFGMHQQQLSLIPLRWIILGLNFVVKSNLPIILFNRVLTRELSAAFDKFIEIIKSTINAHAPLKITSRKQRNLLSKPWLIKGI